VLYSRFVSGFGFDEYFLFEEFWSSLISRISPFSVAFILKYSVSAAGFVAYEDEKSEGGASIVLRVSSAESAHHFVLFPVIFVYGHIFSLFWNFTLDSAAFSKLC
jgi:hypothetical protein